MQLLEFVALEDGMESNDAMLEAMLESLLEENCLQSTMEGKDTEKWEPPKEYFTERKKLMDKLIKWAKAGTVDKNKKVLEKISKKISTKQIAIAFSNIRCAKEVKADTVDSFMTSQGFTKGNKIINNMSGTNLRYKNKFFCKKLSNGDYIEVRILNSRTKDPFSFNIINIMVSCTSGKNSKMIQKIYKGLE